MQTIANTNQLGREKNIHGVLEALSVKREYQEIYNFKHSILSAANK
jgi:hypothetical protein